jgi:hypothetical protein
MLPQARCWTAIARACCSKAFPGIARACCSKAFPGSIHTCCPHAQHTFGSKKNRSTDVGRRTGGNDLTKESLCMFRPGPKNVLNPFLPKKKLDIPGKILLYFSPKLSSFTQIDINTYYVVAVYRPFCPHFNQGRSLS